MSDPITGLFKAAGDVWKAGEREANRAMNELGENFEKDGAAIAEATDKGGFLGGFVETCDVLSFGHQAVNWGDAFNVIPEDPALQEAISGGLNLAMGIGLAVATGGTAAPFLATAGGLLACKDAADALSAMPAGAPPGTQVPTQMQSPPPVPGFYYGENGPRCGPAPGGYTSPGLGLQYESPIAGRANINDGFLDNMADILRPRPAPGQGPGCGVGGGGGRVGSGNNDANIDVQDEAEMELMKEIKKILSNPGLMFEDLIFLLMRAVIKSTNKQAKNLAANLSVEGDELSKEKRGLQEEVIAANKEVTAAGTDPAKLGPAQEKLIRANARLESMVGARGEARAERFEDLKQMLQKLGEMQQSLSNILNSQHETSMAAIRAIR